MAMIFWVYLQDYIKKITAEENSLKSKLTIYFNKICSEENKKCNVLIFILLKFSSNPIFNSTDNFASKLNKWPF